MAYKIFLNFDLCPEGNNGRDGLVGYDAALTQLRSGVRFSLLVQFFDPTFLDILDFVP